MDLTSLYTCILVALGHSVDSNGNVSTLGLEANGSDAIQTAIGGKPLVIPTHAYRQMGRWDQFIAFHPMSENILRGESKVHAWLRERMCERITFVASTLIIALLEAAADRSTHAMFTEQERGVLQILSECDHKTVDAFGKVIQAISSGGMHRFINIFVTRRGDLSVANPDGTFSTSTFNRVAYVTFPIMDELRNDNYRVCGVKMRKCDVLMIQQLMHNIFPGCDRDNHFSYGTNSMVAPHFHALLLAFVNVYNPLNVFAWTYRRLLDGIPNIFVDMKWVEDAASIEKYVNSIVSLPDNEGEGGPSETNTVAQPQPSFAGGPVGIPQQPVFASTASPAVAPVHAMQPSPAVAPMSAPTTPVFSAAGPTPPPTNPSGGYAIQPIGRPINGVVSQTQQRAQEMQQAQQQMFAQMQQQGFGGFPAVGQPMVAMQQPMVQMPMMGMPMVPQMMPMMGGMMNPMMMGMQPMMQTGFAPVGMTPAPYTFQQQPQTINMGGRV